MKYAFIILGLIASFSSVSAHAADAERASAPKAALPEFMDQNKVSILYRDSATGEMRELKAIDKSAVCPMADGSCPMPVCDGFCTPRVVDDSE